VVGLGRKLLGVEAERLEIEGLFLRVEQGVGVSPQGGSRVGEETSLEEKLALLVRDRKHGAFHHGQIISQAARVGPLFRILPSTTLRRR